METLVKTREIRIKVAERKTAEGKKFNVYSTYAKNGRKVEVKFRQTVKNLPTEEKFYTFDELDLNLNTSGLYPVMWISGEYISSRGLDEKTESEINANAKKLSDFFD